MPTSNSHTFPAPRGQRAAFSIVEVAKFCRLSRARFYDLIAEGVMPMPVYSTRTRQPLYTTELAARCVEVRETNTGIDGSYVMFYERNTVVATMTTASPPPFSNVRRQQQAALDPLSEEMIEALRSMGVVKSQAEIVAAIRQRCSQGLSETTFERDLLALYGDLRRVTTA